MQALERPPYARIPAGCMATDTRARGAGGNDRSRRVGEGAGGHGGATYSRQPRYDEQGRSPALRCMVPPKAPPSPTGGDNAGMERGAAIPRADAVHVSCDPPTHQVTNPPTQPTNQQLT